MIGFGIILITIAIAAFFHIGAAKYLPAHFQIHLYGYSLVWAAILIGPILAPEYSINSGTQIMLCLAWIFLYIGHFCGVIAASGRGEFVKAEQFPNFSILKSSLYLLLLLSLIGNILFYRGVFTSLNSFEALLLLRTTEGQELTIESGNFLFNVFGRIYILYIPLAAWLYKREKISGLTFIAILLFAILTAAGSFTRAPVLFVGIIFFSALVILKIRIKPVPAILAALSFAGLLLFATSQISRLQLEDDGTYGFFSSLKLYFLGGPLAFEQVTLDHYYDSRVYDFPYYSLDFVGYFLEKFGIVNRRPSLVRQYAHGIDTNVYTYLDAFYLDFRLSGMLIGTLIYGFIGGVFSKWVRERITLVRLCGYIYIIYAFTFSYMNNELIRSYFLIVLMIAVVIDLASRLLRFNSKKALS